MTQAEEPSAAAARPRVAVVTGSTRGIGLAVARALAADGFLVVGASLDAPPGETGGPWQAGRLLQGHCDVRSEAGVVELFRLLDERGATPDVLVNNAGVGGFAPVLELTADALDEVFAVNVRGALLCMREAGRRMSRRGRGRVVNVGSIAATRALPGNAAYGASKAALRAMTEVFNEELAASGALATYLCLGATYTELWHDRPGFSPGDMLSADDVAATVLHVVRQPPGVRIDEVRLLPPKGIL